MPEVKLVAKTVPCIEGVNTAEEFVAYAARVSNPDNQMNNETAPKLMKYLMNNDHWSPLEMVSLTMEINTTRDIARQILRHRSFSFQEFCMAGDTEVYFDLPHAVSKGKRALYKLTLEELWNKWNSKDAFGNSLKDRISKMNVRIYDENSESFKHSTIKEVFFTGSKDIYEIELENGKKFKSTKEHKVLTNKGFISLEDGFGLSHTKSGKAFITSQMLFIGCNGQPCYQDYNWLKKAKEESLLHDGVPYIARKAGCSYHTIRKWLKILDLKFSKKETASYTEIWNKGKTGYKTKPHSLETIKKMRESARKGSESNLWRGGVSRSERLKIADWCTHIRAEKLIEFNYKCSNCGSHKNLELDHILPVYSHPEKAYEIENIQVLCSTCHDEKHRLAGDVKNYQNKSKGNILVPKWSKIKNVTYLGKQKTYDLEINHSSHNYIANGVVVHNSQRYADASKLGFVERELRLQDTKNRQNSLPLFSDVEVEGPEFDVKMKKLAIWVGMQKDLLSLVQEGYRWALDNGIAKEQARAILPEGLTQSRLYMAGTLRSWYHYCQLRSKETGTQKEHYLIADKCREILSKEFPCITEDTNE